VKTGAQFCFTLRGMAEKKTEHSNCRFTVKLHYKERLPVTRLPNGYGAMRRGVTSFSIWPCDGDGRSRRWQWRAD
jgi:hypothetical protein